MKKYDKTMHLLADPFNAVHHSNPVYRQRIGIAWWRTMVVVNGVVTTKQLVAVEQLNENVIILTKFSSLAASWQLATFSATASNENYI